MRVLMPALAAAAALSLATPASADRAAADACAAKLPANAKMIYAASITEAKPGANIPDLLRSKTRPLVTSGKIPRGDAMGAAQAAGACLQKAN